MAVTKIRPEENEIRVKYFRRVTPQLEEEEGRVEVGTFSSEFRHSGAGGKGRRPSNRYQRQEVLRSAGLPGEWGNCREVPMSTQAVTDAVRLENMKCVEALRQKNTTKHGNLKKIDT